MNDRLNYAERWHSTEGLTVNPQKIIMVTFTNRMTLIPQSTRFFNKILMFSENVTYLGIYFNSKMNRRTYFDCFLNKVKKFFVLVEEL